MDNKYSYYVHWSNFEKDGPFDSFIEAIKSTYKWPFIKEADEGFYGEIEQVIEGEEILYSYNALGMAGFDITRKKEAEKNLKMF
jgi:hypothetical protein